MRRFVHRRPGVIQIPDAPDVGVSFVLVVRDAVADSAPGLSIARRGRRRRCIPGQQLWSRGILSTARLGAPSLRDTAADEKDHWCMTPVLTRSEWKDALPLIGMAARGSRQISVLLLDRTGTTLKVGRLPVVRARPDEMYSVLQNLLTNAVKFTRPGVRPWVSISARQIPYGWRVSVTDNGIGIPAQRRMDVFTLFSRVDSDVEGHGIGLGAVARIVHNLGGRVGAEEASGGGAEVWFELPASSNA